MKILLLTGDAPRHLYLAKKLHESNLLRAHVIEEREAYRPKPPVSIDEHLKQLFVLHFERRAQSESRFFGAGPFTTSVPILKVQRDELNSATVIQFAQESGANLLLSYGVHKLNDTLVSKFSKAWNIHGGLSPWYRGVATLFWPSYMLEPQMTGMTLHRLTSKIDGGEIVHQVRSELVAGDGIHDLANRGVKALAEELPLIFELEAKSKLKDPVTQKTSGKIWQLSDWKPHHLRVIYDFYDDRIVDSYLNGEIESFEPQLVRQF